MLYMNIKMPKLRACLAVPFAAFLLLAVPPPAALAREAAAPIEHARGSDAILADAYARHISGLQVSGQGRVIKVLKDDREGRRHQRFLLRLGSGQVVLVAHNIDLAPRVEGLRTGDTVEFFGEYEWNAKGGVIHWTHRDPRGRHTDGWLKHDGLVYR